MTTFLEIILPLVRCSWALNAYASVQNINNFILNTWEEKERILDADWGQKRHFPSITRWHFIVKCKKQVSKQYSRL
jgi:hypothetical protein